jgi:aspartyl-tRNA(Asn)/glutamyl-tRNA(Gln) amidotransferase subunit C
VVVPIDAAEVRRIAELAQLELDIASVERFRHELGSILDYIALLDELEVDDVAPFTLARGAEQKLRADGPRSCLSVGDALANAPDAAERHFRVPRVLEAQDA